WHKSIFFAQFTQIQGLRETRKSAKHQKSEEVKWFFHVVFLLCPKLSKNLWHCITINGNSSQKIPEHQCGLGLFGSLNGLKPAADLIAICVGCSGETEVSGQFWGELVVS